MSRRIVRPCQDFSNDRSGLVDIPTEQTALSPSAYGRHGGPGGFFLVDPEYDLVVALARNAKSPRHDANLVKFLRTVQEVVDEEMISR
ncbi:MAG: hypothetical protein QF391_05690 [Myxococcota bacterium]|nr:hypothetical protein [Myxococcota bacterium]